MMIHFICLPYCSKPFYHHPCFNYFDLGNVNVHELSRICERMCVLIVNLISEVCCVRFQFILVLVSWFDDS